MNKTSSPDSESESHYHNGTECNIYIYSLPIPYLYLCDMENFQIFCSLCVPFNHVLF
uniref:Uncharacterized protein n=1 Tax=Anguilla anguilla TaxID=7936 RepID=A0A0E9WNP0_ANGAN